MAACCDSTGAVEPVRLLVESGAAVEAMDDRGRTALDIARLSDYNEISLYLESMGAPIGLTPDQ